jgi:hypothetical protein
MAFTTSRWPRSVADLIGWSKAKSCLGETGKPAYRCFLALGGFAGTAARRNPERSTVVDLCRAERPAPFLFGLLLDGAGSGAVGLSPDFASRFLIGYSCCARPAPSRHSPRGSEAEHKALRARLRCRDRLVPREVGQVRPNRPPPIDFRLVNRAGYLPLIRPDDQAEQIVKSEGDAALKFAEYPTYSH